MKIAKKTLSVFLSFLMIFSACSVGLSGVVASAVEVESVFEEDGKYTAAEVKTLLAKAASEYKSAGLTQNSGNAYIYNGNYSMMLAVDALISYAVTTYNTDNSAKASNNTGKQIAASVISGLGITDSTQKSIVNAVLDPSGTTVYSWADQKKHSGTLPIGSNNGAAGKDITSNDDVKYDKISDVTQAAIDKSATIELSADGLAAYLLTFDSVDAIPKKISTRIQVSYSYALGRYAVITKKSIIGAGKYDCYAWNYLTDVDLKVRAKNTKIKKTISDFVKYYDEEVLELTFDQMLEMSAADLYNFWLVANMKLEAMDAQNINNTVRDHFLSVENGYNYSDVTTYIANLYKAYQINLGKDSIDTLLTRIDTDYSEMSYAQMASLYGAVSSAYDVVAGIDSGILNFIVTNYEGYQDKYDTAKAALSHSADYISALYKAMRKQHIIETRSTMLEMIENYSVIAADTNNLEDIDTTQLAAVISKANGINAILARYTAAEINAIISDAERADWNTLTANLASKMAVRDDEAIYDSHLEYFIPYLTQDYTQLDNEALIDLHANAATKKDELVAVYKQFKGTYGADWTDALFTYTVNGQTDLLQDLIDANYSASNSALQSYMTELNHVQVQTIVPYQGITTVDFTNYTDVKTVLKHFDGDLYNYCAEQGWVSSADAAIYAKVATLLAAWKAFVSTDGESQFTTVTYADANGVYVNRYAGDQTIIDAEGNEIQLGYPNDIARDNEDKNNDGVADDNFVVTEATIEDTVVKIDTFITSRDFGALMNSLDSTLFVDEEGNATDLETYLSLVIDSICTDEMMNTMVVTIFPMLVELLEGMLLNLDMGGEKTIESASGAVAFETSVAILGTITGNLNLFLDQDISRKGEYLQREFPEVFADLGLNVYPRSLAKFLAASDPATFGPTTQIYKDLMAADRDWNYFEAKSDVKDAEGNVIAEAGTLYMNYEWGIADLDTFGDGLGIILDSIQPLIQAALGDTAFEGSASDAAFIDGPIKIWGANNNLGAVAGLTLTIQPLNLWNKALVPVFEIFRLDDGGYVIPTLTGDFDGSDVAGALLDIVMALIDQVTAAPLTKILTILPNLIYFLSMDSVNEILSQVVINLNLNASEVDIKSDYSGAIGDIASIADGLLGGLIKFDVPLDLGELLDLDSMLDFELTSINDIIQTLAGDLGLPKFDQNKFMFAAEFERYTSANGETNKPRLKGNPADVLYALFGYAISMLADPAFLTGLLGDSIDDNILGILNQVIANVYTNPNGVIAALMEILNPREYELEDMDWIKQGQYDYNGIDGADNMSIVYLNYGNDWTRADAEYLIENIDEIVATVLEMTGSDIGDINTLIADAVNGIFKGDIFTELVKMLGSLGDSPSAIIDDIVSQQIGIDITVWFDAFGYLFAADTWAEDAVIVAPGEEGYTSTFANITATADEEGNITWYYAGEAYVDGDKEAFVNIMCELLNELELALGFLFGGADISAFGDLVQLKGYETYATTIGLLLELLGVENLPTQAQVTADPMEGFRAVLHAVVDWFDALTASDNMIETILEIVPDLFYFIESNGLSTLIKNILMPVLVIVDDVRPLFNVDINGILSVIVSELLNYGTFDINVLLQYLGGIYMNDDPEFKMINIDVNKITLTEIVKIADAFLGTDLTGSGLKQIGLNGLCSGIESYDSIVGTGYRTTVDAADTLTILLTAVIDCLAYPAQDTTKTNGDVILELVADMTGNDDIAGLYDSIAEIIAGIEYEYDFPNWGYMFPEDSMFDVQLPKQTIVYLGYTTDWDKEAADGVYGALDSILDMVLPSLLKDNADLAELLNGVLEDNVYTDQNLNTIIEGLVGLLANLDATLFDIVDCVLATDITAWFDFCEITTDAEGKKVVTCTKDWGVDAAAEEDKKDIFVAGIKEVLAPANAVLSWLFFGTDYKFFTSSEVDANGNYTYKDLITLNGGEGYAYGLVPLLEALGCTVPAAETFYDAATNTYNVGNAVEAIFNSVLTLVDEISANPVEEVFSLLPNLIYFINADGAKVVVNNLVAPVNAILEQLTPVIGTDDKPVSIGGLLVDMIGLDICDITMDTLLGIALDNGVVLNDTMINILTSLYVGNLAEFESANGYAAYRLDVTGYEGDVLTIILSLAIDLFKLNDKLFGDLLGAENYASIITLLGGLDFEKNYLDMNWAYMYDGDLDKLINAGFPEQTITYLGYSTDWDEKTAAAVYGALDEILELVLPSLLGDNEDLAALVDGILNDNVYTEQNLNTIVEALVGLLVGLDEALYNGVGALLDADIKAWFDMCDITTDADGKTVVECTKDWGVDAASDKKAAFVAGIKEVLNPANKLLSWLFFGEKFTLFNGTTSEVLITLNGGHGYAYGLAPIFEALGCEMKPASAFLNADGTYNVGNAVESILDSALALVDEISANPVDEVFALLPNLLYFINAGGLKAAVNNLLAPVNAVLDCLGGLTGNISIGGLLEDAIGLDICDITMDTVLTFAADYGFTVNEEMAYVLKNLFVGTPVAYTSASGRTAYHVEYNNGNPAHEMLTILLSFAVEAFTINETLFADLLGEDIYWAVRNLIKGVADEFEYLDLNWAYMYEGATNAEKLAALKAANGVLPERTNAAYDVYTLYQNNWNEATADYVTLVLDKLVHEITTAVRSDGSSLGQILDKAIADGLYQDSLLNDLVGLVVNLLVDYEEIIKGAGALLGAESLVDWFTYCEKDEETGKLVCTKDWGIDKAETIDEKRTAFINAFATVLEPAYDLLAWLFFAEDYTFFSATTGAPLITLTGGKGYEEAFVPLFEAVGVLMKRDANGELLSVEDTYLKGESAVLPASYFYTAAGELDMKLAVTTIFSAVSDWLYDICGDLADQSGDGALTSMLERLPNLLYSVNADGLVAVVNNLTAPVMHLLDNLGAFGLELDFNEMIGIEGMDLFNFQFDDLFALLADEDVLGLYFPDYTQEFLKTFYIGELKSYRSANGSEAYFMTYTEEESAAEMITCLIGFVVDAFQDPRNPAILIDWMGEDIYYGIMAVLGLNGVKEMQEFNWMYTEYADTDHTFNATESSVKYSVAYNTIWTRDKAQYISQNLIPFVNNILGLIGLELNGYEIKNVDNLIDSLLNGKLYTVETVDMLLELIRDLVGNLTSLEPYGEYIINVLDKAFGVNLAAWDTMSFSFADGDKDAFVAALGEIIAPVVPLLDVLLCGENIELFYSIAPEKVGDSALIIYGSEGYAYGIVPLFEALGCEMMTPDTFKKLSNKDKAASLINSLLNRIDVIAADPVTEIFKMIPELVYFINSNGLDTAVDNILNSVDTVLIALEPLLGATSLMELLGVDLADFNMDYIIKLACDAISESTGLDCEPLLVDFIAELTMGKVISYTSANGETYYKMVFANEDQMTDMVTVILRLVIDFLATGENADAIIALIANNSESEDAANSASTLINFILTAANTEPVTSGAMATLYYIFYGLNEGIVGIDTLYGNYGKTWDSLVGFFQESDDSYYTKAAEVLKNLLAEIGGVDTDSSVADCDCDCHNNSSFIRFFHKIITFLRKLFGMKEFQYCDCGTAHW